MNFYGFQKVTLLDFPGEVASTIFTFGCNLACPFCHNPELILDEKKSNPVSWKEILKYLKKRKNVLGGVCITGGEPLLHKEIINVIEEIHSIKLKVKIDTNGTIPEILKKLNVDYIAMDIKTSINNYNKLYKIEIKNLKNKLLESIDYIINSGIQYEFRTTVVPGIVAIEDIKNIINLIKGASKYVLSQFRPINTLDADYEKIIPYPISILEEMKKLIIDSGLICEIRGY